MTTGLSTYAYSWRMHPDNPRPFGLADVLESAAALDVPLVQVCDQPALDDGDTELTRGLAALATELGLELELGTKGVEVRHLCQFLELADLTSARFVRSMLSSPRGTPSVAEAIAGLRTVAPDFERAGVTLGLETYEQFSTAQLLEVIEAVGSPAVGVCLDPGNTVARLEHPTEIVRRTAPYVVNLHVKDFAFSRREGAIGFNLAGAPLGSGLLDYDTMVDELERHGRVVNQIVEHWLIRQETLAETCATEEEWVQGSLVFLRQRNRLVEPASYPIEEAHHV
ncbi:MAG: sugar phosphate isomerase/epimerase [Propionibacteriaceae bacterium]|nr:sugar phosphate isomerase/epimerase [Propionibacteriaceae bacterium]